MPSRNDRFWRSLDGLVATTQLDVDRPRGSRHPRYPDIVYPLDYGRLLATKSGDNQPVDVWLGASGSRTVTGIICTVDLHKLDAELKLLLGCSEREMQLAADFHNSGQQQGLLIVR